VTTPRTRPLRHARLDIRGARHARLDHNDSRYGPNGFSGIGQGLLVCGGRPPIASSHSITETAWTRRPEQHGVTPELPNAAA
jgi:hypothetical protein